MIETEEDDKDQYEDESVPQRIPTFAMSSDIFKIFIFPTFHILISYIFDIFTFAVSVDIFDIFMCCLELLDHVWILWQRKKYDTSFFLSLQQFSLYNCLYLYLSGFCGK